MLSVVGEPTEPNRRDSRRSTRLARRGSLYPRRTATVALLSVFFLGITVSDWPTEILAGFWRDHSMTGTMISGVVLMAIGYFLVEEWIRLADRRRWENVGRVAALGVARIPLYQQRLMWTALYGGVVTPDRDFRFDDYSQWASTFVFGAEPENVEVNHPAEKQLSLLYDDPTWRVAVAAGMRELLFGTRELIARWAPVLAVSHGGVQLLHDLADEVERINWLHKTLREPSHSTVEQFIAMWATEFANAVYFNEYLIGLARQHDHRAEGRSRLKSFEGDLSLPTEPRKGRPLATLSVTGACPSW